MSGTVGLTIDAAAMAKADEAVWDDLAADARDDDLREPVVFQDSWRRYISHYLTWALSDGPEEASSRAVHWWASSEALRAYDALVPAGLRWLSRRVAGVHDDMMRDANEAVYDAICLEREEAAVEDLAARWAQWAEIERGLDE